MEKNDKRTLSEEHLRKIKYRVGYKINESARYRPFVNDRDEYDEVPKLTTEAGEQEDAEKVGGGEVPPAPSNDQPVDMGTPQPAFDDAGGAPAPEPEMSGEPMPDEGMPTENPEQQVDELQNDIIKHNIEAMKSIHSQLEQLNNTVQGLNSKLADLNADVEEVREPTNSEKLINKKQVSYPYYFNLNDLWSDNWFTEKHNEAVEKGIRELPDGTYVADFDDLPEKSKPDIQNSFNDMI